MGLQYRHMFFFFTSQQLVQPTSSHWPFLGSCNSHQTSQVREPHQEVSMEFDLKLDGFKTWLHSNHDAVRNLGLLRGYCIFCPGFWCSLSFMGWRPEETQRFNHT